MSVSGKAALPKATSSDITILIVIRKASTCQLNTITALFLAASVVCGALGFPAWTSVGNILGLSMPGGVSEGYGNSTAWRMGKGMRWD